MIPGVNIIDGQVRVPSWGVWGCSETHAEVLGAGAPSENF